ERASPPDRLLRPAWKQGSDHPAKFCKPYKAPPSVPDSAVSGRVPLLHNTVGQYSADPRRSFACIHTFRGISAYFPLSLPSGRSAMQSPSLLSLTISNLHINEKRNIVYISFIKL